MAAGRGVGIGNNLGPGMFFLVHRGSEWDDCLALAPVSDTDSWVVRTTTEAGDQFVMTVVTPRFGECAFPVQAPAGAGAGLLRAAPGHLGPNFEHWICSR